MNSTHPKPNEAGQTSALFALWDFASDGEPPLGAHLVTPRRGYYHHGIYVGAEKVVHYAGLCRSRHAGPVEELSVDRFAANQPVWVQSRSSPKFCSEEVVCRAHSRLGESRYRLLTNNCEHFCNWCLYGESRSDQVRTYLAHPLAAMQLAIRLLAVFWHGRTPVFAR